MARQDLAAEPWRIVRACQWAISCRTPSEGSAQYAYGVRVSAIIAAWAALGPQTNEKRPLTLEDVFAGQGPLSATSAVGITHA
jgi:hypothetical protein